MKPASFEYRAPGSLDEALSLVQDNADAKILAGGQSLVPAMNFRVVQPTMLIDLNPVAGLSYIEAGSDGLRIGAMTRERRIEFDPLVPQRAPLLAEAIKFVAHPQIRNRGTLGGSLANADPAAELPVVMVALRARLKVRSAIAERWVDAKDFFQGLFTTALASDEILVEIVVPDSQPRTGWSFLEVAPRPGDYAMMGVAALITLDSGAKCSEARLVYLNAGDGPVEAVEAAAMLAGREPGDAVFKKAAALASEKEMNPFGNIHASAAYQRHLASVLTQRALHQAWARADTGPAQ